MSFGLFNTHAGFNAVIFTVLAAVIVAALLVWLRANPAGAAPGGDRPRHRRRARQRRRPAWRAARSSIFSISTWARGTGSRLILPTRRFRVGVGPHGDRRVARPARSA